MAPEVRTSLEAARKRATDGLLESQISQVLAAEMHRNHGIGVTSSSPVDPLDYDAALYQHLQQQQPRPLKVHQQLLGGRPTAAIATGPTIAKSKSSTKSSKSTSGPASCDRGNKDKSKTKKMDATADKGSVPVTASNLIPPPSDASNERASLSEGASTTPSRHPTTISAPPTDQTDLISLRQSPFDGSIDTFLSSASPAASRSVNPALRSKGDDATRPARTNLKTYSKKTKARRQMMDFSQSPTQSNDGRSYEQYLQRGDDLMPSDPILQPLPSSHPDLTSSPVSLSHRNTGATAYGDETGTIHFDFGSRDTQDAIPDPSETRHTRQQHVTSPGYVFGNPETPAPPKNPFQGSKAALMGSSQMFKQTQYSSAVKAAFSPTSSRPSPDNLQQNTVSPNSSPLKRPALGPSPLQGASGLPQSTLLFDTSPQQANEDDAALGDRIARSTFAKSLRMLPQAPSETYKPVPRWENRKSTPESGSDIENTSDEDISDKDDRFRRRAARKRAQARSNLLGITFERPSGEAVVPSTNKEMSPGAQGYLDQCEGISRRDSQTSIEDTQDRDEVFLIADSQDGILPPPAGFLGPSASEGISSNGVIPNTDPGPRSAPAVTADEGLAAQIPETSPVRPRAPDDIMVSSPFPEPVAQLQQQPTNDAENAAFDKGQNSGVDTIKDMEGTSIVVSSSPPAPAFSTRARIRGGRTLSSAPPISSSMSPLSRLTTTPTLSTKTTPLTKESPRRPTSTTNLTTEAGSSPAVAKAHRQNNRAESKLAPTATRTSTRRKGRRSFPSNVSVSTDELAGSPHASTFAFEQSTRMSRLDRTSIRESPASRTNSRGWTKIFAGMVFAISFQGKQPREKEVQYEARMAVSTHTSNKVKQGGGKVLDDGFDKLFEFSSVKNADREADLVSSTPQPDEDITLAPNARQSGFTALIADGHSRKAKYMQALALGLPCIHERWITTCVDKQQLVDWSDYLLCAGNSSFLGDAIRSRNLTPYDAATAKLSQVIQSRPRLLDQSRILLLMPRAEEARKAAYIFLARVLGASLSRVYTIEEARSQLKAREDAGRPFDWVYVVDGKAAAEDIFTNTTQVGNKRKRKSDMSVGPPAKRVRALSDELVIQSLILGRLMEDVELMAAVAS